MAEENNCSTCKHDGVAVNKEPCSNCFNGLGTNPTMVHWAPIAVTPPAQGRKDDGGKLDVTLFFDDLPHAIEAVTEVLQWAVTQKKPVPYERGSWQQVADFQRRYRGALLRHLLGAAKERKVNGLPIGQTTDHETGLLQLAHIATDALFMLEMAIRKTKGLNVPEGA